MTVTASIWKPSLVFFRNRAAKAGVGDLTWTFRSIHDGKLPFKFLRCDLVAGDLNVTGQGYALSLRAAMIQAFAEAWERLWMHKTIQSEGQAELRHLRSSNGFAAGPTD